MSCKYGFLAIRPRKQHSLPRSSSQHAGPSMRHLRICSSASLPPFPSPQVDFDNFDLLDSLSEITIDSDLDQRSASSATLFSRRVSPSISTFQLSSDASHTTSELELAERLSESRQSCFLYPLREPGQMTAQRVQRLRARTAAVIMSIPATCDDAAVDADEHEPDEIAETPPVVQRSRLRRVAGIRDLRRAFRDGDHSPDDFAPDLSLGLSKASYELGILTAPTPSTSQLSPRSSLRTLVDFGNGDLKTLCGSTFSSMTVASRFAAKIRSTSASWSSRNCLPTETSQSITPTRHPVHSPSKPRLHRYVSLHQDVCPSRSPGEAVWSCAKISQSTAKRAARRGPTPRRVFSNPIAGLSPQRQSSPVL